MEELDKFLNSTFPRMIQQGLYNQWRREDQEADQLTSFAKGINQYTPTDEIQNRVMKLMNTDVKYAGMQKENVQMLLEGALGFAQKRDKLTQDYLDAVETIKDWDYSSGNVPELMLDFTKKQIEAESMGLKNLGQKFNDLSQTYGETVNLGRELQAIDIDKQAKGIQLAIGEDQLNEDVNKFFSSQLSQEYVDRAIDFLGNDSSQGLKMFMKAVETEQEYRKSQEPKVGQTLHQAWDKDTGAEITYQMRNGVAYNTETGKPLKNYTLEKPEEQKPLSTSDKMIIKEYEDLEPLIRAEETEYDKKIKEVTSGTFKKSVEDQIQDLRAERDKKIRDIIDVWEGIDKESKAERRTWDELRAQYEILTGNNKKGSGF